MLDCRYYDLCCFIDDSCNGEPECPKRDHCQFYSPMPDVKALKGLADEMDVYTGCDDERCGRDMPPRTIHDFARRIREMFEE